MDDDLISHQQPSSATLTTVPSQHHSVQKDEFIGNELAPKSGYRTSNGYNIQNKERDDQRKARLK